jgi:hypothetical protein
MQGHRRREELHVLQAAMLLLAAASDQDHRRWHAVRTPALA